LPSQEKVGRVTKKEMEDVYTKRMVKKNGPGRAIYDKLMSSPRHGQCPLCGQRMVSTLDHYLPKAYYPALVVTPINLIPSCSDCNRAKLDDVAATAEEQTLHPYFDSVESDVWLFATIRESIPAFATFSVRTSARWTTLKDKRVRHHFKVLKLAALYASHAAVEMRAIQQRLAQLLIAGGPTEVKKHLQSEAQSRCNVRKNSWVGALYTALAGSDWYCKTGCKK
jgi:hypothetical protein